MIRQKRAVFITATDTEVGKTYFAALLGRHLAQNGIKVGYYKPISSGGREDALFVKEACGLKDSPEELNPIAFKYPLAPLASARREGTSFDPKEAKEGYLALLERYDNLIVEGIGGLMVPLMPGYFVLDLIREWNISVILVARAGLGTLNHTLLSSRTLLAENITVSGIVLNGFKGQDLSEENNAELIEEESKVPVLERLPQKKDGAPGELVIPAEDYIKLFSIVKS